MAGALVRGGVDDLGAQVVVGAGERLGEVGSLGDQVEHLGDQRAVAVQQVLDPADAAGRCCGGQRCRWFHSAS